MLRTIPPLALLLALADPAHAQFPNTSRLIGFDSLLTLEQCQEPGFLDGASSGQRAFCADLFEDEIDRLAGTADATPERVSELDGDLDATSGVVEATRLDPIDSAYSGRRSRAEEDFIRGLVTLNGREVAGCDEYVYQRFWDYEQLTRDAAGAVSAREVFDDAFRYPGLGYWFRSTTPTPMDGYSGSSSRDQVRWILPHLPPDHPAFNVRTITRQSIDLPKNDFFALSDEELASLRWWDRSMHDLVARGRAFWTVEERDGSSGAYTTWDLHQTMSQSLAALGVADAELEYHATRRAAFRELLDERRRLRDAGNGTWSSPVVAVDRQIAAALREAHGEGCLSIGEFACDWAPSDFLAAMTRAYEPRREAAQTECERYAPVDFRDLDGSYTYHPCTTPTSSYCSSPRTGGSATSNEQNLRLYLSRMKTTEEYVHRTVAAIQDGEASAPTVGFDESAEDGWGDGDFVGATWSRWARGGVVDAGRTQPWDHYDYDPNVDVGAELEVSVFGRESDDLFRAQVAFDARRDEAEIDFVLFGTDYFDQGTGWDDEEATSWRSGSVYFSVAPVPEAWETTRTGFEASTTYYIGPVPVTIGASISGTVGVDVGFEHDEHSSHRSTTTLHAEPYARLDAHGRAKVDGYVFEGGLRADVNLVDVSVPSEVFAERTTSNVWTLDASSAIEVRSLSGRISGYVKSLGERWSRTVASWEPVVDHTIPLYENRWTYGQDTLNALCGYERIHCER
ncbi:MAG TPA: hypothetical protein RMH85_31545 [Polyangiaceae bacterium LLY-WYZ-15_(1-7)]|nr:hypothetical protein [Sandaracinus sp.]HJK91689.1 hypothetical protein [Polyangiaceae bacterium LLY-WYZ-15_(1-7)]HJL00724.1 hypothetical protein [Polyangiaceae bacterium LLY-WYZ-15_(1-7)]HJL13059.1 hypothetical protein [Polyangiaceae bacterium LLY-WYZ-15_(1-7)]HJL49970.1 hypothetical protein [Polyangiaceae bacterium LLY-WYZ-15_(1-7)]